MKKFINIEKIKTIINLENKLIPASFILILTTIWEFLIRTNVIERFKLPAPSDIIITFFKIIPVIKGHIFATIYETIIGFILAIILAGILAVIMDSVKIIKKAVYPLLIISQTVPIIVLAPLFAMWFGFGKLPKIIVVVLVCFFPIVVSILDGLNSVDKDLLNLLKSMGASKIQIFKILKMPQALDSFFSGLKIAATYSVMGAVIGEWLGGKEGLGVYMLRVKHSFKYENVFAVILIIVILSMFIFKLVSISRSLFMPWKKEE